MKLHPACKLFPKLGQQELQELADDIKANGLHNAIVLLDGKILDGRNRHTACKIAGVEARFIDWDGSSSPIEWVISQNLMRRHLTASQRAVIALDLLPMLEKEAKQRQRQSNNYRKNGRSAHSCADRDGTGRASEAAARIVRSSARYVKSAKSIVKSAPELLKHIRSGDLSLSDAKWVSELAALDRRSLLAQGNGLQAALEIHRRKSNGIGGHEKPYRGESNDWLTPKYILDDLGNFALAPCAALDSKRITPIVLVPLLWVMLGCGSGTQPVKPSAKSGGNQAQLKKVVTLQKQDETPFTKTPAEKPLTEKVDKANTPNLETVKQNIASDQLELAESERFALRSGPTMLQLVRLKTGGYGLSVRLLGVSARGVFAQDHPLSLEVVDHTQKPIWLTGEYSAVEMLSHKIQCKGVLVSRTGTMFHFADEYSVHGQGGFELLRRITISSASPQDVAFMSRFGLTSGNHAQLKDYDLFVPGVWYRNNRHVRRTALASDYSHQHFYFREDRLPLPIVMMRARHSGITLALGHYKPDGSSFLGDRGLQRVVDERLQFGSLGVQNTHRPTAVFLFPGTEGEKTYVNGGRVEKRWALRSHPIRKGVKHSYRILMRLTHSPDFPSALRETWRYFFDSFATKVQEVNLEAVYRDGIAVLDRYAREYDGVPGLPFSVNLPDGSIKEISFQMGFVGQQIHAGYLLIKHGLENNIPRLVIKGEGIVEFWTRHSLLASGLPRTWYDIHPRRWRDYKTFLRIASDGAEGVLLAWSVMARHDRTRPTWLKYCERFGNWLVTHQNSNGSFYRQYDFNDNPVQKTTLNTTHPIKFLIDLHLATGNPRYLKTAVRAGQFCLKSVHKNYQYVGGTPDDPDVIDKEAGLIAFDAFLALYDATKKKSWLDAAVQAACFSETWMYSWNVPMVGGDSRSDFPKHRTTSGLSLIATGHSGADMFMAYYPFQYYRLFLYTGDTHFRDVARMLLHNTKQTLDWDGSLRYAHRGLQTEAMSIAYRRGYSVRLWLPWLTVATLDPLVQLRDTFGSSSIDEIEQYGVRKRQDLNRKFAKQRNIILAASLRTPRQRTAKSAYLDSLGEIDFKVGHGTLGRNGSHGYGSAMVAVKGRKAKNALSIHPPKQGSSYVRYRLGGKWKTLTAMVAISDSATRPSSSPLTFKVFGDGRLLWKSHAVRTKGVSQKCRINIQGVEVLKLSVECPGNNAWSFAVWINPMVSR